MTITPAPTPRRSISAAPRMAIEAGEMSNERPEDPPVVAAEWPVVVVVAARVVELASGDVVVPANGALTRMAPASAEGSGAAAVAPDRAAVPMPVAPALGAVRAPKPLMVRCPVFALPCLCGRRWRGKGAGRGEEHAWNAVATRSVPGPTTS